MKALTLHQPWASLVAVGAKTIETRSWRTDYRGPLAIHAAMRQPDTDDLEDDCAFGTLGDESWAFQWAKPIGYDSPPYHGWHYYANGDGPHPLPLGDIVASATLIDCVPIVDGQWPNDPDPIGCLPVVESWQETLTHYTAEHPFSRDLTGQAPFGDFSPGRFAWLLGDVAATTERCPWCWGKPKRSSERIEGGSTSCAHCNTTTTFNFIEHPGKPCSCAEARRERCPVCEGRGSCDPVPAKGRQGLWEWTP